MELICIDQTDTDFFGAYEADFHQIAKKARKLLHQEEKEWALSVIAVTPEAIHEINRTYRQVDRPTDVISFALQDGVENVFCEEEENELGDIFINVQAVQDQAAAYGHSQRREACFLFCHGLLHLLGYDHMEPDEERVMFGLQDEILCGLANR